MKKYLLYILAAITLASCTKQPSSKSGAIASGTSYTYDTTVVCTEYHIAAVDGDPISDRYWENVKAVYTDSVRTSHVHRRYGYKSESIIDTTYARRDTFTDVRNKIGYLPYWNGWVIEQMISNSHSKTNPN